MFSAVQTPIGSKDVDEQLNQAHRVVDFVNRASRTICVTLLRYNVNNPESSYAQIRTFAKKKDVEKLQQIVFMIYNPENIMQILYWLNSVNNKVVIKNQITMSVKM